jgi:hypothetical protein
MVAWLLVCVSKAETAGREKGVLGAEQRKKEVEKYIYIYIYIYKNIYIYIYNWRKKKKKKKKVGSGRVGSGTRRIGLNGYPLKQAGRGNKRVFLTGRGGAGRGETGPIPPHCHP